MLNNLSLLWILQLATRMGSSLDITENMSHLAPDPSVLLSPTFLAMFSCDTPCINDDIATPKGIDIDHLCDTSCIADGIETPKGIDFEDHCDLSKYRGEGRPKYPR